LTQRRLNDRLDFNESVRTTNERKGESNDAYGRTARILGSRSNTTFSTVSGFERDYDALSIDEQASIGQYMNRFENDYQNSTMDMELRNSYQIEVYVTNPYKLWQIYLRRTYRAFVFFHKKRPEASWVALFRKGKQREQQEIEVAKARARVLWNQIKGM